MRFSLVALFAFAPALVLSQSDTSKQLDPSATCPYQTGDQIQTCLAQVESDESTRAGGPCTDSDWACICNKQQGLIDCYKPCPGTQDKEDVDYNNNNCAGQHGVRNVAAGGDATYSGSPLTTTAGADGGQSTASATATTSTSSAGSTSAALSSTASRTSSASSSGAASASASSGNSNAALAIGIQGKAHAAVAALAAVAGMAFVAA